MNCDCNYNYSDHYNNIALHHVTLHCAVTTTTTTTTTSHYATLTNYLHYTTLHYTTTTTPLHYTTLDYTTQYYATAKNTTVHYITLHYANYTRPQLQLQLQLHYTNYITLQLQLHYATTATTTALHHTTSSSCGWGDCCNHCGHSKKHNRNHLSVHQWICSAIHTSQQLTYPIVSYLWNFRPPCAVFLVYVSMCIYIYIIYVCAWSNDGQLRHDRQVSYLEPEDPIISAGCKYVYQVMHHTSESHREIHAHVKHTNNARKWLPAKTIDRQNTIHLWWLHCFAWISCRK